MVILIGHATSGISHAQIENTSFPVTNLEETARIAALGGYSPSLVTDDTGSFFANPALLSTGMHDVLSFTYLNHVAGISSGTVAYGRQIDSLSSAAIGVRYLSFGTLDRADEQGNIDGTFGASNLDISLGGSRVVNPGLRFGASVHLLMSSLDGESASAIALDTGLHYEIENRGLSLGLTAHNLGVVLSSIGATDAALPLDIRIGVTKKLAHTPLLISVSAYRLNHLGEAPDNLSTLSRLMYHTVLGGEFQFSKAFQLRFGYNFRRHNELAIKSRLDFAGVSTGFGLNVSKIGIDYAFSSWSSIGGLHRFTLRTSI